MWAGKVPFCHIKKSHWVRPPLLQETPHWPVFSVLSEEHVSEQLTGTTVVSWPQAHVSLGSGPRDSQGLKVTEGRQRWGMSRSVRPWVDKWCTFSENMFSLCVNLEDTGHDVAYLGTFVVGAAWQ